MHLSLREYIKLAQDLIRRERPQFVNDEDAISAVVEDMIMADERNEYTDENKRAAYRRINGKFGLKRYTSKNTGTRHITTRQRRTEVLNLSAVRTLGDSEVEVDQPKLSAEVQEIYTYVLTFHESVREPFIRHYFLGQTKASISREMNIYPRKLRQLLEEGLGRVRRKFS